MIAVVDDDPYVSKALARLFRSAGFEVDSFATGMEFLRSVENREPDCLVLDLHMPKVDGFDVQAQLLRDHSPVPIVVITGHDTPEARSRALGAGAKSYLCKPVDDKCLLDAINEAIESSQPTGDKT